MLVVSKETPQILQDLGLKNWPITMTQKHLNSIMNEKGTDLKANYHNLGEDVVKQLPKAIKQPLNVLKSSTKDDSIVIITELSDKNDNIVVASIKIDGKGRINDIFIDTNVMTSAYGKSNYDSFMKRETSSGNLLYDKDDGIIKKSSTGGRVQFPTINNSITDNNIPQNNKNVKLSIATTNSNMKNYENNVRKLPINNKPK